MGFFTRIFGEPNAKQVSAKTVNASYAPGTEIAYDNGMISRFKGHHQVLLKLYGEVSLTAKSRDYGELARLLKTFNRVFEQHVLEENLRFYIYLEKCLNDSDHTEMVGEMKMEMNQIGRTVRSFVRHHIEFGINQDNIEKFIQDLSHIGAVLADRIEREENSLYTLYLPPISYQAVG